MTRRADCKTISQGHSKAKYFLGNFLIWYLQKCVCALTFTHNSHNPNATTEAIELRVMRK